MSVGIDGLFRSMPARIGELNGTYPDIRNGMKTTSPVSGWIVD